MMKTIDLVLMMFIFMVVGLFLLLVTGLSHAQSTATGANVNQSVANTLFVDPVAGQDCTPGCTGCTARTTVSSTPFKTVGAALSVANTAPAGGVKVVIKPGVYREAVSITPTYADTWILEGQPGAVMSGADPLTGWTNVGPGVYTGKWLNKWGLAPIPNNWPALADYVRRREVVFVGGVRYSQVLTVEEAMAQELTFFVDEPNSKLFIHVAGSLDPNQVLVEVGARSSILTIKNKTNLVVRGLKFIGAPTPVGGGAAVNLQGGSNHLIENNEIVGNNNSGLVVSGGVGKTVSNNRGLDNGLTAITIDHVNNLVFRQNDLSANNFRGAPVGFYWWVSAGVKSLFIHNALFEMNNVHDNLSPGIWFDTDVRDVTVQNNTLTNNKVEAFNFEAVQGPVLITGNVVSGSNMIGGVRVLSSDKLTLTNNVFYNNSTGINVNTITPRSITDYETGVVTSASSQNLSFSNNMVVAGNATQWVFDGQEGTYLHTNFLSNNNVWYQPGRVRPFVAGGKTYSLAEWQAWTGQDLTSK